ncbi:MAG: hypothetical protein M1834_004288 [Cirrosporium novae-zelandiae]|nr:MAG: hypothetical protein M1834_004288 [Cirrosporium novae-zelandiae]
MALQLLQKVSRELGLSSLIASSRDTKLLCLQRFVRLFAYGCTTLILALYLSSVGVSDSRIGAFMSLTLLGDVAISFLLTLFADALGRRKILAFGAGLMTASGIIFSFTRNYWMMLAASVVGVISPSGNEIGPFKAVEESTLSHLTSLETRSDILAWYTLLGAAGTACGTIVCGWLVEKLQQVEGWKDTDAYRMVFILYACLGVVKMCLTLMLSRGCEAEKDKPPAYEALEMGNQDVEAEGLLDTEDEDQESGSEREPEPGPPTREPSSPQQKGIFRRLIPSISHESRTLVLKLCLLFGIDSTASGLVPLSWMTYFFSRKFSLPEGNLGTLFFVTNIISSASTLVASSIAKRIGLVKAMVFTHLPSAIMLALIPAPNVVWLAMIFLVLRSCTSSMDQAPRQAFLAAAVLPNERTAVMGMVNVVKTLSQSIGLAGTGLLAGGGKFWMAFVIAGSMKAGYDLAMLKMFSKYQTREQKQQEEEGK